MAGIDICSNEVLDDWVLPNKESRPPDIYVFGFQEIVELNVGNIFLSSNDETVIIYKNLIQRNLNQIGK